MAIQGITFKNNYSELEVRIKRTPHFKITTHYIELFDRPYSVSNNVFYNRYKSWERCRNAFSNAFINRNINNPNYGNLALNLAWYLASWGMLRGSSFLLQCDYSVHIVPIRDILLNKKYEKLFIIDPLTQSDEYLELLFGGKNILSKNIPGIVKELKDYYTAYRGVFKKTKSDDFSNTLITKILLGVFGCIPAYDDYFMKAMGYYGIQKTFSIRGVKSLLNALRNYNGFINAIENTKINFNYVCAPNNKIYTFMKIVDIVFWKIGEKI
ncbi:MAG: hypothetical protein J6B79_05350 [Clostridia bacterium]|nr:hypothetical protein [Clostridia bacterium]